MFVYILNRGTRLNVIDRKPVTIFIIVFEVLSVLHDLINIVINQKQQYDEKTDRGYFTSRSLWEKAAHQGDNFFGRQALSNAHMLYIKSMSSEGKFQDF